MQRFWSRLGCLALLVLSVGLSPLSAQQSHQTMPSAARSTFNTELQNYLLLEAGNRQKDAGGDGFVVSGGVHATAGSMTSASFATVAYSNNGHYISQSSAAIDYSAAGCSSSDTGWVVVAETASGAIGGNFSRVGTTRYAVNCTDTSQPSLPSGTTWLMKVTIAGSAITQVVNLGRAPMPLQRTMGDAYNVLQHGLTGNCSTNDAAALQHLADTMPSGSTLYFPQTTGGCYLFGTTRVNITKEVHIRCENWKTILSWDTENATDPGCVDGDCQYGGLNIYHPDLVDGTYLDGVSIEGCHFTFGGARGNTYEFWKRGININQASNVVVRNNWVQNVTGEALGFCNFGSALKANRTWVEGNYISNFAQVGINPNCFESTLLRNRLEDGVTAVEMGRSGIVAIGNEAFDLHAQLFTIQTTNAIVAHNICRSCYGVNPSAADGVITVNDRGSCYGTSDLVIDGNVLVNTTAPPLSNVVGITIYNSGIACPPEVNSHISIRNNTIGPSFVTGIYVDQCNFCDVSGNNVQGATGVGLAIATGPGEVLSSMFSNNRLSAPTPIQDATSLADGNTVGWNYVSTLAANPLQAKFGGALRSFTAGDTTPSVRGNFFWAVANAGATSITALDDIEPGNPPVCLRFNDGNTTLVNSSVLRLAGAANFTPSQYDVVCFINDGGGTTYEVSRSVN